MLDLRLKSSDQDNIKLDNSYLETAVYALYKINIINHITNKAALAKNFHIQPSEIDKMPMWEYELFMKALNDQVKEENEQQKKEMDKYDMPDPKKLSNPSSIMKSYTPKMPSIPKI